MFLIRANPVVRPSPVLAPRRPRTGRIACGLVAALLLAGGIPGVALEPSTPLASFGRQTWMMENGLPQNTVKAVLQTRNGFVWLGTEVGLVRFDGNAFEVFDKTSNPALPGNDVQCMVETRDDALWIGTSEGLAQWKNGAVKSFTTQDGLPGNDIRALAEDSSGTLWVYTDEGLARLGGQQRFEKSEEWRPGTPIATLTGGGMTGTWVDTPPHAGDWKQAAVWAGLSNDDLWFLVNFSNGATGVGNKSTLVLGGGEAPKTRLTVGQELAGSRIQALLADHQGTLWIGTNGGLARWTGGKLERLPVTDPLAAASVLALMEDREGNIWAGTETGGLHILRDQRFKAYTSRDGLPSDNVTTVVEDRIGALWVGTNGGGLNVLLGFEAGHSGMGNYTVRKGLPSDVILSLAAASNGDMWVGTPDGLSRIRQGQISTITSADGLPDDFIRSLLVDTDGSLWIGTRRGLTHWTRPLEGAESGMRMETFTQSDGLGSDLVGAMVRDTGGDLWIATLAGLSRLHEGLRPDPLAS